MRWTASLLFVVRGNRKCKTKTKNDLKPFGVVVVAVLAAVVVFVAAVAVVARWCVGVRFWCWVLVLLCIYCVLGVGCRVLSLWLYSGGMLGTWY